MSNISFNIEWEPPASKLPDEIEATIAALRIDVDGKSVTAFRAEDEADAEHIELPLYYTAEWIAENWWALLWEPRKSEDSGPDDGDFIGRHYLASAEHGFPLPNISFVSNGAYINVTAQPRQLPFSEVKFYRRASLLVERTEIGTCLRRFVDSVCARMSDLGHDSTYLQERWSAVLATDQNAEDYCAMVGALGLSPYAVLPQVDEILERLSDQIGVALTRELCQVARPADLERMERAALLAVGAAHKAEPADLTPILDVQCPKDNLKTQAWQRGTSAARLVRERLNVASDDPSGSNKIFDALRVDPSIKASIGNSDFQAEGAAVVGAALREDRQAKISFIQRHEQQRRFAAARGIFSVWTAQPKQGHLLTQAVTRHQQASRAFAAEIVAPVALIRGRATKGMLFQDDIENIAYELKVGSDVIYKQAVNNGLQVAA